MVDLFSRQLVFRRDFAGKGMNEDWAWTFECIGHLS